MQNEQYIKIATMVCCPLCDEDYCVGRYNCPEIQEYIKSQGRVDNAE